MMKMNLIVNGYTYQAEYSEETIEAVVKPLIIKLSSMKKSHDKRMVVFLAAPPAVGKSTLAEVIAQLSRKMAGCLPIQNLSLDGFHYTNEYLKSHTLLFDGKERYLSEIKGMPETFDLEKFKTYLSHLCDEDMTWPEYHRPIHDVIEDAIKVTEDIVLIEGNWLLLSEEGWANLSDFSDYNIFIEADASLLMERLIGRKMRGGLSKEAATLFYQNSDLKNILRVMNHRVEADMVLAMTSSGDYQKIKGD